MRRRQLLGAALAGGSSGLVEGCSRALREPDYRTQALRAREARVVCGVPALRLKECELSCVSDAV